MDILGIMLVMGITAYMLYILFSAMYLAHRIDETGKILSNYFEEFPKMTAFGIGLTIFYLVTILPALILIYIIVGTSVAFGYISYFMKKLMYKKES